MDPQLTDVFRRILVKIDHHNRIDDQPEPELDKHDNAQQDVHQHGCLEQRQECPLVIIVGHVPRRPRAPEILPQTKNLCPPCGLQLWRSVATPPAIGPVGDHKRTHLCHSPRNAQCDCGGQNQPWWPAKGTLRNSGKRSQYIPSSSLLGGLQRTHIPRQEGKNRDPNAALPRKPQHRPLQNPRIHVFFIAGCKQIIVPGTSKMRQDHQKRSNSP